MKSFPLPVPTPSTTIPAVVHQIWVGSEVPLWTAKMWDQWDTFAQDDNLTMRRWTDDDLHRTMTARVWETYPHLPPVVVADLLRVELVHRHGGMYMDSDTVPLKSLSKWTGNRAGWLGQGTPDWDEKHQIWKPYYNNATFGFPAGHPYLSAVWERAMGGLRRGLKTAFGIAGPVCYRAVYNSRSDHYGVELPTGPFQSFQKADKQAEKMKGSALTTAELRAMHPDADVMHLSAVSWKGQDVNRWMV